MVVNYPEFMADGFADGLYAPGVHQMQDEDGRNEFQQGNAVCMRNWVYAQGLLSDEEESAVADTFDVAPLPTFDGEGTISAVGGVNNAMPDSRARPAVPEWNDISVAMQQNISPADNGEQDVQDAIDAVRQELEAAVDS